MGTYFTVYADRLASNGEQLDSISKAIFNAEQRAAAVSKGLNGSLDRVRYSLNKTTEGMREEADRVSRASDALKEITSTYVIADLGVSSRFVEDLLVILKSSGESSDEANSSNKAKSLEEFLALLKKMGGKAPIGKTIFDYIDLSKAIIDPNIKDLVIGALKGFEGSAYYASVFEKFIEKGSTDGWKKAFGLSSYFGDEVIASVTFTDYLKQAFEVELKKYHDFSDASKTAGTIAKWAGAVIEVVSEGFENYEEFKDSGNWMKMFGETVLEAGTDLGLTIASTAFVGSVDATLGISSGILTALGVTGGAATVGTAILAGAGGVLIVWAANEGCKWLSKQITGTSRDIGEVVSDIVMGLGEVIVNAVDTSVNYFLDLGENIYNSVSDGLAQIGESFSNWFGFGW